MKSHRTFVRTSAAESAWNVRRLRGELLAGQTSLVRYLWSANLVCRDFFREIRSSRSVPSPESCPRILMCLYALEELDHPPCLQSEVAKTGICPLWFAAIRRNERPQFVSLWRRQRRRLKLWRGAIEGWDSRKNTISGRDETGE